ncbi:MAG: chromosomal replication initiator protein DnaA [Phycisphaerales bacterium JB037]
MTDPDRKIWDGMLAYLRAQHPAICRQWFEEIEPLGVINGTLHLRAHSAVHRNYLHRQCLDPFTEAAQNVTGNLLSVRFLGPEDEIAPPDNSPSLNGFAGVPALPDTLAINPDYNFGTFVVGPGNRYAHAAALAVGDSPGITYNPLFIHGMVGLGKTHLLQAICLRIQERDPDATIHYLSCEDFVSHFTEAIRTGQVAHFRHWFRDVDILVLDDIHFLASRERSQEEFFHAFNTLYQQGKQIVLSSDAPPEEIPDLEDRLVSRFKCGLVSELEPPDFETRVAILKSKAAIRGLILPDDVAAYVASRVDRNIRELEGAITKLHIRASADRRSIDMDLAHAALGEKPAAAVRGPTIQTIIDVVTDFYSVKLTDLQSKRRQRSIAQPRQICMYLARRLTRHSLEEIGGYFGGRDHTTVMHAVKAVESRSTTEPDFEIIIKDLESRITNRLS